MILSLFGKKSDFITDEIQLLTNEVSDSDITLDFFPENLQSKILHSNQEKKQLNFNILI